MHATRSSIAVLAAVAALALLTACCGRQSAPPPEPGGTVAKPAAPAQTVTSLRALPHVTLIALSDWQGVIKPCGCVEELQRGGVERIAAWLKTQRAGDDSVVVVHAGALLSEDEAAHAGQEAQRLERATTFAHILDTLDLAAVALSAEDLKRGGEPVRALLAKSRFPLLAHGWKSGVKRAEPRRVVTTGSGVKVGLFSLSPETGDLARLKAAAAEQVKLLRAEGAAVVVALSNLDMRSSRRVARAVQGIDAVVLGRVPPKTEPVEEAEQDGDAWMLMAPRHGAYMATLTLAMNGEGPWRDASAWLPGATERLAQRVKALEADLATWRGPDQSVATRKALPFFERQLKELKRAHDKAVAAQGKPLPKGKLAGYASVGLPWSAPTDPAVSALVKAYDSKVGAMNVKLAGDPLPPEAGKASYVGEAVCSACHQPAAKWAEHDKHHHAWETLVKAGKTKDLDCVPCHVTGWRKPGGSAFKNLERFQRVQCEACHGPGSLHVAAAKKTGPDSGIVRSPDASVCGTCHTPEHAPRFSFRDYVPKLRAPGHGLPAAK